MVSRKGSLGKGWNGGGEANTRAARGVISIFITSPSSPLCGLWIAEVAHRGRHEWNGRRCKGIGMGPGRARNAAGGANHGAVVAGRHGFALGVGRRVRTSWCGTRKSNVAAENGVGWLCMLSWMKRRAVGRSVGQDIDDVGFMTRRNGVLGGLEEL